MSYMSDAETRKYYACQKAQQELEARFPVEFAGSHVRWSEGEKMTIRRDDNVVPASDCIEFLNAWSRGYLFAMAECGRGEE